MMWITRHVWPVRIRGGAGRLRHGRTGNLRFKFEAEMRLTGRFAPVVRNGYQTAERRLKPCGYSGRAARQHLERVRI